MSTQETRLPLPVTSTPIATGHEAEPATTFPIRSAGHQAPLFIVPAGTGDVARLSELAAHVNCDGPVYVVPWPQVLPKSMDALAAQAIQWMRQFWPQGPCRILGASFGARLAYAVAQQLEELDEVMDFVGLLDCDIAPQAQPSGEACCQLAVEGLWSTHFVQPLQGLSKLHLFQATALDPEPTDEALQWRCFPGPAQVELVVVPGTRMSMLERPHLPTLGRLVGQALAADRTAHRSRVHEPAIVLHAGEAGQAPMVCVPGAGASVTSFVSLSMAMGDRPLLGMQPRGVVGGLLPYGSVELAARRYIEALHAHVPAGPPIHLLGHSFGGWVAFEMALQLSAAGCAPASVTLVDVGPPLARGHLADHSRQSMVEQFLDSLALRAQRPLSVDRTRLHALDNDGLIAELHRLMVLHGMMPARSRPEVLRGTLIGFSRSLRTGYCPTRRLEGLVHLVQAPDPRANPDQDAKERSHAIAAWAGHAASLKTWQGPGNHMTILDTPHVTALAHWWKTVVLPSTSGHERAWAERPVQRPTSFHYGAAPS